MERTIIRFLYDRPEDSLLVTWGISLVLQQLAQNIFGAPDVSVTTPKYLQGSIQVTKTVSFATDRVVILIIALAAISVVAYMLFKTRFGRNITATMQNRKMAASMGINTKRIDSMTFALGTGLAGLAGCTITWIDQ